MNYNSINKENILEAVNLIKTYGFYDQTSVIELLLRTVITKDALAGKRANKDILYKTMQENTSFLARFPGDSDLFNNIYGVLSKLNKREMLSLISHAGDYKEIIAPAALVQIFSEYIVDDNKKVLITELEQYGPVLLDLIEANPNVEFSLTTRQAEKSKLLTYIYSNYNNVKIINADIYTYGFTTEKFDYIFSIPTFGGRLLVEGEDFISREPDLIAVQNLLYHINIDGNLIIVLPAKITFGGGNVAYLREYIEKNYRIKEICSLPANLFSPHSSIRTYMFVFSSGRTDDVVLKQYESDKPIRKSSPCEKLIVKNEVLLFNDEFAELNGWSIDIAFSGEDDDIKAFSASPVKKLPLKDVATVFRGKAINERKENGNVSVINISNITNTGIDYDNLDQIEEEERKVSRYVLEDGDVLVTARGTTIKVAVFEKQPVICIPSANINVIRPKDSLRGTFLKIFLESPVGIKMLQALQRGTVVVNINYKDVNELEVPVLPLEDQDIIIAEYNEGLKFYKDTIAAAEEGWKGVQKDIQAKLF